MEFLKLILSNSVLFSALYSWFIAQFLKIIIEIIKRDNIKTKNFVLKVIFGTGGMPSSHSAAISAIAVSIGITEGFDSSIFAFAVVLVIIVIRDATGVRLSAGRQAEVINRILENQYNNMSYKKIREVRGHTPLETFVGALVGILVSLGMYLID